MIHMTFTDMQHLHNVETKHPSFRYKCTNKERIAAETQKKSSIRHSKTKDARERSMLVCSDVRAGWNAVNGEWARSYFKTKGKHIDPNTRTRARSAKSSAIIKNL